MPEAIETARRLKAGGCDIIEPLAGQTTLQAQPVYGPYFLAPYSDQIRNQVGIATITSGRLQVMSAGSEDVGVRWIGDDALLVGRFPARVRSGDRTISINERYSALWSRQDGRWRLRHEHSSLIPDRR